MSPVGQFDGILSGLNTKALIDSIIRAERAPIRQMEQDISDIRKRSEAFLSYEGMVSSFEGQVEDLAQGDMFRQKTVSTSFSGSTELLSASATEDASPGSHEVEVLQLAKREKVSGSSFTSETDDLGFSGEFNINGTRIGVASSHSLQDIVDTINNSDAGVDASILSPSSDDHRLVLTSEETGADGINFADSDEGLLRNLGVLGNTTSVKHSTSDGAKSDAFASATETLADLRNLSSPAGAADVSITDDASTSFNVNIDLANDSLTDIKDKINSAASGAGANTTAQIVEETVDGEKVKRLDISKASSFTDTGRILETVGVLKGNRPDQLQDGQDASITVDSVSMTRETNTIDDAINGVTLNLENASSSESATVDVNQAVDPGVKGVKDAVAAYNKLAAFTNKQFSLDENGEENSSPLSGSGTLRSMQRRVRSAMTSAVNGGSGEFDRLYEVGVEIQDNGTFKVTDESKLEDAIRNSAGEVERLFGVVGETSANTLEFMQAGEASEPGTYAVEVTQAATRASAQSSGFDGTYTGDTDNMHVRQLGSNSTYSVQLSDGMTTSQIVDALNTEFDTALEHRIKASESLEDASGNPATESTTLADVHQSDGTDSGIADGDVITLSGTTSSGSSFTRDFEVTDASTQTLGDIVSEVEDVMGSDVDAYIDSSGNLRVDALETGTSDASLSASYSGGGSFSFGTISVTQEGRAEAKLTAENVSGDIEVTHDDYGDGSGFEVSYDKDGDGSFSADKADLIAAGTYKGQDVQGTIGGHAATGAGRLLTGDDGTAVEDLSVRYTGTSTGVIDDVTFSRGIAAQAENTSEPIVGTGEGSISDIEEDLNSQIDRIEGRIDDRESHIERERERLVERFARMERTLARTQRQGQFLLSRLPGGGGGSGGGAFSGLI